MLAVELTSLEALSPPATGRTITTALVEVLHRAVVLECLRLSARPFSLSCDSGTNRLAIWTESSHDFRNEIFLKKKYFI